MGWGGVFSVWVTGGLFLRSEVEVGADVEGPIL